jgi:hypothetical protein
MSLLTYTPSRRARVQHYLQPCILRNTDPQMPETLLPRDAHVQW